MCPAASAGRGRGQEPRGSEVIMKKRRVFSSSAFFIAALLLLQTLFSCGTGASLKETRIVVHDNQIRSGAVRNGYEIYCEKFVFRERVNPNSDNPKEKDSVGYRIMMRDVKTGIEKSA